MEEIFKNLANPAWWFTAVVMAVFTSLIAGYLRDRIPSWLSKFSKSARIRSFKRKKIIVRKMQLLIESPQLHISTMLSASRYLFIAVLITVATFMLGPIHLFYEKFPSYDPLSKYAPDVGGFTIGVLTLFMISVMIPRYYRLVRMTTILSATHRRLHIKAIRSLRAKKANKKMQPTPDGAGLFRR